jgi:hypothetical protein
MCSFYFFILDLLDTLRVRCFRAVFCHTGSEGRRVLEK